MIVKTPFTGVIAGKEIDFKAGDKLTKNQIKILGLDCKPDLIKVAPKA